MCGLAGIVTVKKTSLSIPPDLLDRMELLFRKIEERDMEALLKGSLNPEFYLDGGGALEEMEEIIRFLKTDEAWQRLFTQDGKRGLFHDIVGRMKAFLAREEKIVDDQARFFSTDKMEIINGRLVALRDLVWSAERDILENLKKLVSLSGSEKIGDLAPGSLRKYKKINFLLNCLDRLEVRGRDSAGIHIAFTIDAPSGNPAGEILGDPRIQAELAGRQRAGDLVNGSISRSNLPPFFAFTYKTASVVGALGLNTANLRESIGTDRVFKDLSKFDTLFDAACAHTRWASVGAITAENCHPVNNFTNGDSASASTRGEKNYPFYGKGPWTITVALNGDIDNYPALRMDLEEEGDFIAPEVTTDTKVIPLIIQRYLRRGDDLATAFRRAVNDFEGSHAVVMMSNLEPDRVFLALKGSGQSLYVGLAPDQYIFSSEIYGLVEITPFFIKMDGERRSPANGSGTSGQIFILDQDSPGGLAGLKACFYDGLPLEIGEEDIRKAEITTRDIDRGEYPHYFLKEISESARSVQKTLRGKYRILQEGPEKRVIFNLGEKVLPKALEEALIAGRLARIMVIGHGTAAVAGQAIADALERYLEGSPVKCEAKVASELSGFCLDNNLNDTLVIAITQSGTTTDTNRAVAMARECGATVVAVVNRRQSDITTKAQGVFYTSDGRDIEMSVASTKAFYSQIVAGHILALHFAQLLKTRDDEFIARELGVLEQAPQLMARVLDGKDKIRLAAEKLSGQKKYWALVGSGPNKAAADEIRIKLSELCYQTISSDVVENKKHIDLSAEPLIIVCAAGSPEAVLGDIVKDVAIFKAHKAAVLVFADEGENRFAQTADAVIELPRAPLPLPVVLNTLAGHLWGYYAARAIDEDAVFFRAFRSRLHAAMAPQAGKNDSLYKKIGDRAFLSTIREFHQAFHERRRQGAFTLSSIKTISDLVLLLKYASGKLPLEDFWEEFPSEGNGVSPFELLDLALGSAVEELSRPVDAIRHQAKTVTVGTSRKEPPLPGVIFDLLRELEFTPRALTTKNILALTSIQPAIEALQGYTLYDVGNLDREGHPTEASTISIARRGGVSQSMKSRVESCGILMGTKKTIVSTGHIYVGFGKSDGASILIVPLLGGQGVRNLLLAHIAFNESLSPQEKKNVLGYKYNDIRNLINEYNLPWDDCCLESLKVASLLSEPVEVIAERIRGRVKC